MRATPVNDAYRAASTLPANTPSASPGQGEAEARPQVPAGARSVTSHSISLNTGTFSLDYTWQRVEMASDGAASTPSQEAQAPQPSEESKPRARATAKPPRSFSEVLRRQQLAQLLLEPSRPPASAVPLSLPGQPVAASNPQPKPVCRAYSQALGPLANSSVCYSA